MSDVQTQTSNETSPQVSRRTYRGYLEHLNRKQREVEKLHATVVHFKTLEIDRLNDKVRSLLMVVLLFACHNI